MAAFHFREAYNKRKKEEEAQGSAVRTQESDEKKFNFRQAYEERIKAEEKSNRPYAYEPPKTSPKVEQKRYSTQQEALKTGANVKDMEWYAREKAANRLSEYATYSDYLTGEVTRQKGGQSDAETARQTVTELNNWLNRSGNLLMQYAKEAAENGYQSKNTLNSRRMVMDDLAAQAGEIKTSLYANKDILGEKETENAVKAIDAQLNWNGGVNAFTKQKSEIMAQFANEDDYNRAVKDEEYRNMPHEERLKEADRLDAEAETENRDLEAYKKDEAYYYELIEKRASRKELTKEEQEYIKNFTVRESNADKSGAEADRLRLLDKQILDEQESDYWDSLSAKEMQEQQKYFLSEIEKDMAAYENEESPANQRYYLDEIQRMRGWYDNLYRREQIKEQQENFDALSKTVQDALIEKAYAERIFGVDAYDLIEAHNAGLADDLSDEKYDEIAKAQFDLNASGLSDEEIEEQMKYARRIANERYTQRRNEIISDYSTKNFGQGAFSSVMSVPANLIGGVEGLLASIGQYLENSTTGRYQEIDTNSEAFDLSNYSDAVRSSITENLGGGDSVLGFLYGTGMSMADFAALAPLGGSSSALVRALPSAVLGMSSATSTIKDTVERGGTTEQALVNGIFAGAAEMLCEKYSLENLFSLGNESNIKAVLKNAAKQTLTEGSEEAATDLVNFMADQIVMGDLSEYNLTKQAYIMQGMTEEDAAKQATSDFWKEVILDFTGGALSGSVMGGLTSGIHYANSDIRNAAKLADYEGQVRAEYNESYQPKDGVSYEQFVQQEAKRRLIEEAADSTIQKMEKREAKKQKALNKATEEDKGIKLAREAAERQMREADAKQSFPSDKVRFSEVGDDPIFKDADGKTVHENEISYKDENERAVYEAARKLDNVRAANAMINTYEKHKGEQAGGTDFADGYCLLYDAGKTADTYEQVMRFEGIARAANNIGEAAARSAFYSGQNVTNQVFFSPEAEAKVLKSGGVLMNTSRAVSDDKTNFMLKVVDAVGKKYGRVFEVRDDLGSANGYYRESDNRIVLSLHAQDNAITRVAGHELTHFIQKNAPTIYRQMADVILTALKADPNYDYEGRAKWLKEHNPTGDADEEIVAESMFDALSNETTVKELLKTENRTFFEKVRDWIDEFIGYIDETIQKLKGRKQAGAEIRSLQKQTDVLKKANDLFYQALEETKSVGNQAAESMTSAKYSLKEYSEHQLRNWANSRRIVVYENEIQYRSFVHEALTNKAFDKKLYFGAIPIDLAAEIESSTGLNIEGFNCSISAYEIRKIVKDHGNQEREALRGQKEIMEADFLRIPKAIASPQNIYRSNKDYEGKPVIVFEQGTNEKIHVVGVVSDKHLDLFVQTAYMTIKKGDLSTPSAEQAANNTPEANRGTISTNSIRKTNANVNVLNSENMSKNKEQAQGADNVNKFSIKDIENYSETEYNQYGWAVVNDVLSRTEYRKLNEQFAATAHGEKFERTKDGYYVIPVGEDDRPQNAFVFIRGTISKPVIGSIMIIDAENEMELDDIRGSFKNARSYESFEIAENIFGIESVRTYHAGDFEAYRAVQRQASEMRRGVRSNQGLSESGRGNRDDQEAVWGNNQSEQGRGRDGGTRYSIKEAEEQATEKALLRENEHLKKMVVSLKEQMKLTKGVQVRQADIEKLAKKYIREYRSDADEAAVIKGLQSMFEYIGNDPDRNGETAFLMAKNISQDIIENSRLLTPTLNEDYAEVREYLKNTAVYFPQNVRSDIFYNDFRKEMFGRVKIRDTGVPVDAYFNELKGMFPEFSRYDVQSDVQAAEAIADIASRVWTKTTPDGTDADVMAIELASELFDAYFDIPQFHSFADRQKAKLDSLRREYRDGKRKLRAELKEKYEGRISGMKEAYRDRERERIQKEEHDSLVRGIARSAKNLSRRLINPTDKQNIPIVYRVWVGETLSEIDFSKIRLDSSSQKNAELQEMMTRIHNMANWRNTKLTENQKNAMDESLEIDPEAKTIRERVRLQINQLYEQNGKRAVDLSIVDNETLKQINNILTSTLHTVTNYNKVLSKNHRMTISQMGEKTIADNYGKFKRRNAIQRMAKQLFQIDAASLETYLTGLGDVGADIWKMFRQGEADKVNCIRSAQHFVESVYADMPKDFKKALNSKELITYKFKNGSVSFTKQQLMELYALSRRAQAMQHIENGGIITGDMIAPVAVSKAELNNLFNEHLTDVEKDFVVRLQRYLSTEVAEWGNRVTRREFGEKEAEFVQSLLKGKRFELPIYYDLENNERQGKLSKTEFTEIADTFCAVMEDAGYFVGVYANTSWFTGKLDHAALAEKYTIWLADYYRGDKADSML